MRIVLCAASIEDTGWLKRDLRRARADLVIGVDRGVGHLIAAGVAPGISVGDWDSFPRARVPGLRVDLPRGKNYSDFALAFAYALSLKPAEILVYGILGGRKDHEILALEDLRFLLRGASALVRVRSGGTRMDFLSAGSRMVELESSRFSLWAEAGVELSVSGAEYSLSRQCLEVPSHGLSNSGRRVRIRTSRQTVVGIIYSRH